MLGGLTGSRPRYRFVVVVALAALLAAFVATAGGARAQEPETSEAPGLVDGEVPQQGFALLSITQAATPAEVRGALEEQGCAPVSLAITQAGSFVVHIPGAPAFVNAAFPQTLSAGTSFVVTCAAVPQEGFSTATVDEWERDGVGVIRTVRVAEHEGFDRFVLEFDSEADFGIPLADGVPGYRVEYIPHGSAQRCGSGFDVELEGAATLQVNLPFGYVYDPELGELTVEPREIATDYQVVRDVKEICGFEGQSIWVIGLTGEQPFRVTELQDPVRLVIDIATEG